jgi:quercetin dioxygenase-like cupin family protein
MMKRVIARSTVVLAAAPVILLGIMSDISAQEQKEEYVSKAERTNLIEASLPGAEGKIISINRFKLPAGFEGGRHSHTGPTYVYVVSGTFKVEVEGKGMQTFEAGELYQEPLGQPMQGFNESADEPIELLVIQVQDEGEPLMVRED